MSIEFIKTMMKNAEKEGNVEFFMPKDYDLKAILDTVQQNGLNIDSLGGNDWIIYTNEYLNECMEENDIICQTRYSIDKVYDILSEDFINLDKDEDFINFVDMLNDVTLIDLFGETEEDDILDTYLTWLRTE